MKKRIINQRHLFILTMVSLMISCGVPSITSFTLSGPERSIVELQGDLVFSRVIWDAGATNETVIPSGFLGANFFSVPPGATLGNHNFQIERGSDRSSVMTFNVTPPRPNTAPRLDHVTIGGVEFNPGNLVSCFIMAQGANVDVGAEILINGTTQSSISYKVLINDLLGIDPNDLDFPIYHYTALLTGSGDRPTGSTLQIRIQNLDGQMSNIISYALPANALVLDSDGDNIPDDWEENGYDADNDGVVDIDLAALGANKYRKDMFLECDIMNGLTNAPNAAAFQAVQNAFTAAPIMNFGNIPNGMNLVIDRSGTVPFSDEIDFGVTTNPAIGLTNFVDLKNANFNDTNRGRIYHYAIWANARPGGSSGRSDVVWNSSIGDFGGPGDDLIVSFDDFPGSYQTDRSGAETLMHEFGHNLIQRHGGSNHFSRNPTYNSVMSYNWQIRTGHNNATRRSRPCCPPLYYGQNGATEVSGAVFTPTGTLIDYSEGMGRDLVENNLNETIGICGNPIDWNFDGDTNDTGISFNIGNNSGTTDTHTDYCNWCNLNFRGPELNGDF